MDEQFKEFVLTCQFRWQGFSPARKLVCWVGFSGLCLLAFAAAVTGMALLIGPR